MNGVSRLNKICHYKKSRYTHSSSNNGTSWGITIGQPLLDASDWKARSMLVGE